MLSCLCTTSVLVLHSNTSGHGLSGVVSMRHSVDCAHGPDMGLQGQLSAEHRISLEAAFAHMIYILEQYKQYIYIYHIAPESLGLLRLVHRLLLQCVSIKFK